VHLHADDFWGFVGTGRISPERPEAQALNSVVMEAIAGAAAGYARGGFLVVVDCIVGPWFLSPFLEVGLPLHYVVLRVDPALAIARCQARGGNTLTDPGSIAALNHQFRDLGSLEGHALDVDNLSPEATVAAVEAALASGTFRLAAGLPTPKAHWPLDRA
jgi:hypothetical protein